MQAASELSEKKMKSKRMSKRVYKAKRKLKGKGKVSNNVKAFVNSKIRKLAKQSEVKRWPGINLISVGAGSITANTVYHTNPLSLVSTNVASAEGAVGRSFKTLGFKLSWNANNIGAYLDGVSTKYASPKGTMYIRILGIITSGYTAGSGSGTFSTGYGAGEFALGKHLANNDAINKNIDTSKHRVFFNRKIKITSNGQSLDTNTYDMYNCKGVSGDAWVPYKRKIQYESYDTAGTMRIKGEQVYFLVYSNVDWLVNNQTNWLAHGRITLSVDTFFVDS